MFVGIDTNSGDPDYVNIYIEGEADGWVAVGFSETRSMVSHSVLPIINSSIFAVEMQKLYVQYYTAKTQLHVRPMVAKKGHSEAYILLNISIIDIS